MVDPGLVEAQAANMLAAANAAISVEVPSFRPTAEVVAAVLHDEGKPIPVVVVPDPAVIEITTFRPTVLINGVPVDPPQPRIASRIRLALIDDDVREIFRHLDHPYLAWADLYKVAEVVERSVGGRHKLLKLSWIDEVEYKRCHQTANYYRHAKNPNFLPQEPMTLTHAKKYMRAVVDTWLRNRHGV